MQYASLSPAHHAGRRHAKQPNHLGAWIAAAQEAALPGITGFATGLTLPHHSGPVDGNVNRIKMIKRQMYGRAGLILLAFAGALDRLKEVGTVDRVTVTCSHPTARASRI